MSLLSWFFGDEENAQRAAEADAKLRELNRERYGVDYVNGDEWVPPARQEEELSEAFDDGWDDGKANVQNAVGGAFGVVGDVAKAAVGGIPLWVWIMAGGFVWFQLGMPGLAKLRAKLR